MRWNESHAAGFTTGEPWLPVGANSEEWNVASLQNPCSILWLYRRLIQLRREDSVFTAGDDLPIRRTACCCINGRGPAGKCSLP